jgi:hypothetical protein
MRRLKVAYICQHAGYESDFVFRLLGATHPGGIVCVAPRRSDLLIVGPFWQRWLGMRLNQRTVRKRGLWGRRYPPRTLHQTGENTRWNAVPADFSISSDLGVAADCHYRFPLWMAIFDWSHEGVEARHVERFGPPAAIERLMRPLGSQAGRQARAVLVASHLNEPRRTLLDAVRSEMDVDCYGRAFAQGAPPPARNFLKVDVSADKQFALCPENSLYPGYYTEKIAEAFACGCIPITWCDANVSHDFNPQAIVNLAPFARTGYAAGLRRALEPASLAALRDQPLLLRRPSLDGLKAFLQKVTDGL